jgi:hypothetical protein
VFFDPKSLEDQQIDADEWEGEDTEPDWTAPAGQKDKLSGLAAWLPDSKPVPDPKHKLLTDAQLGELLKQYSSNLKNAFTGAAVKVCREAIEAIEKEQVHRKVLHQLINGIPKPYILKKGDKGWSASKDDLLEILPRSFDND